MQPDQSAQTAGITFDGRGTGADSDGEMSLYRNGRLIYLVEYHMQDNIPIDIITFPPNSVQFIDSPPAGTHIYTCAMQNNATTGNDAGITWSLLYARPF